MEQKRQLPRLKKKNRTLVELGSESLAAALHHQELAPAAPAPADQGDQEQRPPAAPLRDDRAAD